MNPLIENLSSILIILLGLVLFLRSILFIVIQEGGLKNELKLHEP